MPFPLSDTLIGVNFDVRVSWDTVYDRHTWSVGVGECGIQYLLDSKPSSGVSLEVALGRQATSIGLLHDLRFQSTAVPDVDGAVRQSQNLWWQRSQLWPECIDVECIF